MWDAREFPLTTHESGNVAAVPVGQMNFEKIPPIDVRALFVGSFRERVQAVRWTVTGGVLVYCMSVLARQFEPTWSFFLRPHIFELTAYAACFSFLAPRLRRPKRRTEFIATRRIGKTI